MGLFRHKQMLADDIDGKAHDEVAATAERKTGVVAWFDNEKGYDFITPDDGGKDLFAHYSAIEMDGYRKLLEGQRVEFEIESSEKGQRAVRVRVVDREASS